MQVGLEVAFRARVELGVVKCRGKVTGRGGNREGVELGVGRR